MRAGAELVWSDCMYVEKDTAGGHG